MIDLSIGEPEIWNDYWENKASRNESYPFFLGRYPIPLDYLENVLRKLHSHIGNVYKPDQYQIVIGNSASQLLQAALATDGNTFPTKVWAHPPYFPRFPLFVKYSGNRNLTWDEPKGHDRFIEIITIPNNPDNKIYLPKTNVVSQIHDCTYMWPQYGPYSTNQIKHLPEVMIFSLAKAFGIADLRLGWALVKDIKRAKAMEHHVEMQSGGVSLTIQSDVTYLLEQELDADNTAIAHGMNILDNRWALLKAVLKDKTSVSLKSHGGMFLWLEVPNGADWLDATLGIKSAHGEAFGSDRFHCRINVACQPVHFDYLLAELSKLD